MKKIISSLIFVILIQVSFAQKAMSPSLTALVKAELDFSRTAHDVSLRQAFLKFMAPEGIRFEGGEAKNAIKLMEKTPETQQKQLLSWEPVFVDIASTEDFGYSTGPWMFFQTETDTIPAATGYYSTVWAKQSNGEWKILADLGVGFNNAHKNNPNLYTSATPLAVPSVLPEKEKILSELLSLDKSYLEELNKDKRSFSPNYFSKEGRIHRQREAPYIGTDRIASISEAGRSFQFEQIGGAVSKAGDMGFSYGKTKVELTVNGSTRTISANYMRVWKKENGKDWKIVLDVIGTS